MISDTEQVNPASSEPKISRKITIDTVNEVARLIATRKLTEKECCLILDIKEHTWRQWKVRNKNSAKFENIITRMRADKISGLVAKIEAAADDKDISIGDGKVITKRGDWRAGAWILERHAPDRFYLNATAQAPTNVTIQISTIHEQLKRVIGFTTDAPRIGYEASLSESSMTTADNSADGSKAKLGGIKMPIRKPATSGVVDI